MSSEIWQRLVGRELTESLSGIPLRIVTVLSAKDRHGTTLFAAETSAVAIVVHVSALLSDCRCQVRWSHGSDATGAAIYVSEVASSEEVEVLSEQLSGGELVPEAPRWALIAKGSSALSAHRVAGPTAAVRIQDEDGESVRLTLFPIRLSGPDPMQALLEPEGKIPEGGKDNLDKREEWFQGRSGKDD